MLIILNKYIEMETETRCLLAKIREYNRALIVLNWETVVNVNVCKSIYDHDINQDQHLLWLVCIAVN